MLKIKKPNKQTDKRSKALQEVLREEKVQILGHIAVGLRKKLKKYLVQNEITYSQWLSDRIEEL